MKNVITIFHKPSSPSSKRVLDLLKQHQTTPAATQNDNKASNHTSQNQAGRNANFELDVSEANPTSDQLRSILDFVGDQNIGELIPGEEDSRRAIEKMAQDAESFQRPVVCHAALQVALPNIIYHIHKNHRLWIGMVVKQVFAELFFFPQTKLNRSSDWR